jgi:hypothetical protein
LLRAEEFEVFVNHCRVGGLGYWGIGEIREIRDIRDIRDIREIWGIWGIRELVPPLFGTDWGGEG